MCSSGAVIARKNCKSERIRTVTFKKQLLQEQRILALVVVQLQVPYVLAVTLPAIVSTPNERPMRDQFCVGAIGSQLEGLDYLDYGLEKSAV